ncbi:hypothetical protein AVEN_159508-1 [Araneus ventricosus]|uniref:Uncharacterized protein n=1 Tax=Araneus ventricosus TaxID=182803 RepID=A0A4Y2A187_ARAVE|nr:hypothetical protein AVEN_159508-1 [Araneus ventricosus]
MCISPIIYLSKSRDCCCCIASAYSQKIFGYRLSTLQNTGLVGEYLNLIRTFDFFWPVACNGHGGISDERPTVVRQHCHGPIPLVPFFHVGNVLMKTFAVLITDLPAAIIEEIQMGVQKVDL